MILILCIPGFGFSQTTPKPKPANKLALESAVNGAEAALKAYRATLTKYADLSDVAATAKNDAGPIRIGGMGTVLIKSKLTLQPPTVDPFEITTLFANIDTCALNAALTAGSLKPTSFLGDRNAISEKRLLRNLEAANALIENVKQLN
jgi:hypothetical protein